MMEAYDESAYSFRTTSDRDMEIEVPEDSLLDNGEPECISPLCIVAWFPSK